MADPKLDKSAERSRDIFFSPVEKLDRLWEAYNKGFQAALSQRATRENLYPKNSVQSQAYEEGWTDGTDLLSKTGKDAQ